MKPNICSLCHSVGLTNIRQIKSPYTSNRYALYKCDACGSLLFNINEHPTELDEFYNDLAVEHGYLDLEFKGSPYWANQVKIIRKIKSNEPLSVMDVGCRTGDFLLHWTADIRRVGIELSSLSADVAQKRGLLVHQTSLEKLQNNEKYDVVTCYAVLEHLSNPTEVLNKLTELVAKDGILVIMVPSYQTVKAKVLHFLNYRWHMFCPPEHLNFYSREFLDSYFQLSGFDLKARYYTSGGMFNPFKKIPLIRSIWSRVMWWIDTYSFFNTLPVFDHMYSYYAKR